MNNDFYFLINSNFYFDNNKKSTQMQNKYNTNNHMTVAQQVEGLFFYMMLKSMRNSFPRNTLIENNQERIYEDIYDQFITQKISEKGLGLAKMIEKQIQETKK